MIPHNENTKIENMRVHGFVKAKLWDVVRIMRSETGIKPTFSEAINIMCDHFLASRQGSM